MPEPKAQLIDPQGPIDVPGMQVTGVTTATGGFVGQVQGAATGLASTTANLSVGIVTATKFQGNTTGNVSGLADDTNINVGIITSTSFTGDLVGNAAGLSTTTANINAGIMSATSFAGNFTGVASGITGTPNIVVGIMTGTLNGDGSSLTGIAATNWIANNVTGNSANTSVNLSLGNVVKFSQSADTTVSFANTGTSNIVTFIRSRTDFTSGGVDFDGSGDYLSLASSADFNLNTGDWTVEWFAYPTSDTQYQRYFYLVGSNASQIEGIFADSNGIAFGRTSVWASSAATNPLNQWNHYALVHDSTNMRLYINGTQVLTSTDNFVDENKSLNIGYSNGTFGGHFTGKLSNFRIVKGTALYTSDFGPPTSALTNVTNTKLLCCQSTSSTTTAAVTPGTITANGDVSAGSRTITLGQGTLTWPSSIKWDGGSAPTLDKDNLTGTDVNVITLLTRDEGVTWYGWETMSKNTTTYQWWTWGRNETGALGQNTGADYSSPVQIPGSWTGFNKGNQGNVAAQGDVNIGAKADGTLWGWGDNEYGALGLNNRTQYSSPVQIPGTDWGGSFILASINSYVIKSNGEMWCMGRNGNGTMGQNSTAIANYSSPVQIPGTTWKTVTTAEYATAATKTDGTLWTWGNNGTGKLGHNNPDTTHRSSPTQIPGTTWDSVAGGYNSILAVKTDGTLWGWGANANAQLGVNDRTNRSSPTQIPGTTWKAAATWEKASAATKTDGTLWTWGMNYFGNGGLNNTTKYSSPVQVPGTTWKEITSMNYNMYACKTDGTLWAWGLRDYGQLAQNNTAPDNQGRSSPIQIPGKDTTFIAGGTKYGKAFVAE